MTDQPPAAPAADSPLDTSVPFTRAAGVRAGLGKRLRGRAHRQLLRGIYLSADIEVTPLVMARAAVLPFGPRAWASHATAARVYGVPLPPLAREHVTVPDRRSRHTRLDVTCHLRPNGRIVTVEDVRLSSPRQVFLDLAPMLSLVDLVVVGDDLVRQRLVSLADLRAFCAEATVPGPRRPALPSPSSATASTRRWRPGCGC